MRKYDYVLFDLDGTITDPGEGITNSVAYVLEKYGIPVPPRQELYKFIGPPLKDSFQKYYGLTPENAQKGVFLYREFFDATGIFQNKVLPGSIELLKKLKAEGYTVILATSKPEIAAKRILDRFGFSEYFDYACGADLEGRLEDKADVIKYAFQTAGITNPSRAIMIGDRRHDVDGARANGIDCIGVLFGYGSREELEEAKAVFIAQTFEEVYDFISR